jgi:hypothetical protein
VWRFFHEFERDVVVEEATVGEYDVCPPRIVDEADAEGFERFVDFRQPQWVPPHEILGLYELLADF